MTPSKEMVMVRYLKIVGRIAHTKSRLGRFYQECSNIASLTSVIIREISSVYIHPVRPLSIPDINRTGVSRKRLLLSLLQRICTRMHARCREW